MAVSRLVFAGTALVALGAAMMVAARGGHLSRRRPESAAAVRPVMEPAAGPKAVIDRSTYDAGIIEAAAELDHTFVIRNEGDAAAAHAGTKRMRLHRGRAAGRAGSAGRGSEGQIEHQRVGEERRVPAGALPARHSPAHERPRPPGYRAGVTATVNRRVTVLPSALTLSIDSSKPPPHRNDRSKLGSARSDGSNSICRWPSSRNHNALPHRAGGGREAEGASGAPWLPGRRHPAAGDGGRPLRRWIEFAAQEKAKGQNALPIGRNSRPVLGCSPRRSRRSACRLEIHGRVNGRLTFCSPKIADYNVLHLGTRPRGERIRETLVVKVNDPAVG